MLERKVWHYAAEWGELERQVLLDVCEFVGKLPAYVTMEDVEAFWKDRLNAQ